MISAQTFEYHSKGMSSQVANTCPERFSDDSSDSALEMKENVRSVSVLTAKVPPRQLTATMLKEGSKKSKSSKQKKSDEPETGQRKLALVMLANNGINTVNRLYESDSNKEPPTPSFSGLIRREKILAK
jgi:hypothetical protein